MFLPITYRTCPDPHSVGSLDPDPQWDKKLDPDPQHCSVKCRVYPSHTHSQVPVHNNTPSSTTPSHTLLLPSADIHTETDNDIRGVFLGRLYTAVFSSSPKFNVACGANAMHHKDQMVHLGRLSVRYFRQSLQAAVNNTRLEPRIRGRLHLAPVVQGAQRGRGGREMHHHLEKGTVFIGTV